MNDIDLTGLKELHYPIHPNWWPLSYGWYLIFGFIFLLVLIFIYKKRTSPLTYANREIIQIQKACPDNQLKLLSQLLKRVAILHYGRDKIAPLSEKTWQEFLLASAPSILTKTQAYQLAYAIYNPKPDKPDEKLFFSCQKWIERVLKNK